MVTNCYGSLVVCDSQEFYCFERSVPENEGYKILQTCGTRSQVISSIVLKRGEQWSMSDSAQQWILQPSPWTISKTIFRPKHNVSRVKLLSFWFSLNKYDFFSWNRLQKAKGNNRESNLLYEMQCHMSQNCNLIGGNRWLHESFREVA